MSHQSFRRRAVRRSGEVRLEHEAGVGQVRRLALVDGEDRAAPVGVCPDGPAARALQDDGERIGGLEGRVRVSEVSLGTRAPTRLR